MKALAFVIFLLFSSAAWGHVDSDHILVSLIPDATALVSDECENAPFAPCFNDPQPAIDYVEAAAPNGFRLVRIFHKVDGSAYVQANNQGYSCDLGTGHTVLRGGGHLEAINQFTLPILSTNAGLTSATLTMGNCTIDGIHVSKGEAVADFAIDMADEMGTVRLRGSRIQGAVDANGSLVTVDPTAGAVNILHIEDSEIVCDCSTCGATQNCIEFDSSFLFATIIVNSAISITNFGPAHTDFETIEILEHGGRMTITDSIVGCEVSGAPLPNCFGVDSTNAGTLKIHNLQIGKGLLDINHGDFMVVQGAANTYAVEIGAISGIASITGTSVWGSLIPRYMMGCSAPHSVEFDPDETQVTFVEIGEVNDAAGHAPAVAEATVDNFITPRGLANFGLTATVDVAPGAGQSWTIDIRDDGANTLAKCVIDAANTTCNPAAAGASTEGQPIAAGSRGNLMISPSAAPAAAAELIVSYCLAEMPN